MDALAGYGSDSDNSDLIVHSPGNNTNKNAKNANGIASLLGHYAGDSSDDDNDNNSGTKSIPKDMKVVKNGCQSNANGEVTGDVNVNEKVKAASNGQPTNKRRKRWDNPNEEDVLKDVLPPPPLLTDTIKQDPYQSLTLFHKDYTTSLRHKLSQQLQTQSQQCETEGEAPNQQLSIKLEHLYHQFQKNNPTTGSDICSATTSSPPPSSFAAHLKSKREFGNPHLLKTIIDHFHIQPLQSHVGNTFMGYEYVDRLISAEERARVSAVDVCRGEDLGKMSGSGDYNYHLN